MHNLAYAPPPFVTPEGEHVIFVDFSHATYDLTFDAQQREASVTTNIRFTSIFSGFPAISMNQPVQLTYLNGEEICLNDRETPDKLVTLKVLSKQILPGTHDLTIKSALVNPGPYGDPIEWLCEPTRLHCIFNMSDLQCRQGGYLEAFLPSNYNFDRFRMRFLVTVKNSTIKHSPFANGVCTRTSDTNWKVDYPSYFTSSCPWFHFGPSSEYSSIKDEFLSCDGRSIPIVVYARSSESSTPFLRNFATETTKILKQLESDFGPFPHGSVVVYARKDTSIAMEYAGATATHIDALRHELDHSYFARSVVPANGDAGWIDEAIAMWGDSGYPRYDFEPEPVNMGDRSEYMRITSGNAYTEGRQFLAHLDFVLRHQGGLKEFLSMYARRKRHQSITSNEFQAMIEDYYGAPLQELFDTFVYSNCHDWKATLR